MNRDHQARIEALKIDALTADVIKSLATLQQKLIMPMILAKDEDTKVVTTNNQTPLNVLLFNRDMKSDPLVSALRDYHIKDSSSPLLRLNEEGQKSEQPPQPRMSSTLRRLYTLVNGKHWGERKHYKDIFEAIPLVKVSNSRFLCCYQPEWEFVSGSVRRTWASIVKSPDNPVVEIAKRRAFGVQSAVHDQYVETLSLLTALDILEDYIRTGVLNNSAYRWIARPTATATTSDAAAMYGLSHEVWNRVSWLVQSNNALHTSDEKQKMLEFGALFVRVVDERHTSIKDPFGLTHASTAPPRLCDTYQPDLVVFRDKTFCNSLGRRLNVEDVELVARRRIAGSSHKRVFLMWPSPTFGQRRMNRKAEDLPQSLSMSITTAQVLGVVVVDEKENRPDARVALSLKVDIGDMFGHLHGDIPRELPGRRFVSAIPVTALTHLTIYEFNPDDLPNRFAELRISEILLAKYNPKWNSSWMIPYGSTQTHKTVMDELRRGHHIQAVGFHKFVRLFDWSRPDPHVTESGKTDRALMTQSAERVMQQSAITPVVHMAIPSIQFRVVYGDLSLELPSSERVVLPVSTRLDPRDYLTFTVYALNMLEVRLGMLLSIYSLEIDSKFQDESKQTVLRVARIIIGLDLLAACSERLIVHYDSMSVGASSGILPESKKKPAKKDTLLDLMLRLTSEKKDWMQNDQWRLAVTASNSPRNHPLDVDQMPLVTCRRILHNWNTRLFQSILHDYFKYNQQLLNSKSPSPDHNQIYMYWKQIRELVILRQDMVVPTSGLGPGDLGPEDDTVRLGLLELCLGRMASDTQRTQDDARKAVLTHFRRDDVYTYRRAVYDGPMPKEECTAHAHRLGKLCKALMYIKDVKDKGDVVFLYDVDRGLGHDMNRRLSAVLVPGYFNSKYASAWYTRRPVTTPQQYMNAANVTYMFSAAMDRMRQSISGAEEKGSQKYNLENLVHVVHFRTSWTGQAPLPVMEPSFRKLIRDLQGKHLVHNVIFHFFVPARLSSGQGIQLQETEFIDVLASIHDPEKGVFVLTHTGEKTRCVFVIVSRIATIGVIQNVAGELGVDSGDRLVQQQAQREQSIARFSDKISVMQRVLGRDLSHYHTKPKQQQAAVVPQDPGAANIKFDGEPPPGITTAAAADHKQRSAGKRRRERKAKKTEFVKVAEHQKTTQAEALAQMKSIALMEDTHKRDRACSSLWVSSKQQLDWDTLLRQSGLVLVGHKVSPLAKIQLHHELFTLESCPYRQALAVLVPHQGGSIVIVQDNRSLANHKNNSDVRTVSSSVDNNF